MSSSRNDDHTHRGASGVCAPARFELGTAREIVDTTNTAMQDEVAYICQDRSASDCLGINNARLDFKPGVVAFSRKGRHPSYGADVGAAEYRTEIAGDAVSSDADGAGVDEGVGAGPCGIVSRVELGVGEDDVSSVAASETGEDAVGNPDDIENESRLKPDLTVQNQMNVSPAGKGSPPVLWKAATGKRGRKARLGTSALEESDAFALPALCLCSSLHHTAIRRRNGRIAEGRAAYSFAVFGVSPSDKWTSQVAQHGSAVMSYYESDNPRRHPRRREMATALWRRLLALIASRRLCFRQITQKHGGRNESSKTN